MLNAASSAVRDWLDEEEEEIEVGEKLGREGVRAEYEDFADAVGRAANDLEGIDFPGMYG
jgi:hypothetical protein